MKLSVMALTLLVATSAALADEPATRTVTGYGWADSVGVEFIARDQAARQAQLEAYTQCSSYGMHIFGFAYPDVSCTSVSRGEESMYHCTAWVTATCTK